VIVYTTGTVAGTDVLKITDSDGNTGTLGGEESPSTSTECSGDKAGLLSPPLELTLYVAPSKAGENAWTRST
jgi:hypothetical protein